MKNCPSTTSSHTLVWTRWFKLDWLSKGNNVLFSFIWIHVQVKIEREGEIWSMGRLTHFDSRGKLINNAKLVWATPDISPKFALVQELRFDVGLFQMKYIRLGYILLLKHFNFFWNISIVVFMFRCVLVCIAMDLTPPHCVCKGGSLAAENFSAPSWTCTPPKTKWHTCYVCLLGWRCSMVESSGKLSKIGQFRVFNQEIFQFSYSTIMIFHVVVEWGFLICLFDCSSQDEDWRPATTHLHQEPWHRHWWWRRKRSGKEWSRPSNWLSYWECRNDLITHSF